MEKPFNMKIVGKTHYLLPVLEKDYMTHFESIILLCPTFEWNGTYHESKYRDDPDFIAILFDQDDIDAVLKRVMDLFKGTNNFIILHACASGQKIKNRTSEAVKLGLALSTIVVTQMTSVAKPHRENILKLVTLYTSNQNDMKTITEDCLNAVDKAEKDQKVFS